MRKAEDRIDQWSAVGARASDRAEILEGQVRPAYEAALQRAGVTGSTRYLDVGCGAGMAAQMAAARGARVTGTDTADALLDIARERVPTAQFHLADLEELPFAANSFDLVTGFNSFLYAANPVIALAEAQRVTRPGGTVAVVTWGLPDRMEAAAMIGALRPLLPAPPPGASGPFALSEEAALRAFAAEAELVPTTVFDVDCPFQYVDEATALRGFNSAGAAVRAMEHSSEQAVTEAHAKALAAFRQPDGRLPNRRMVPVSAGYCRAHRLWPVAPPLKGFWLLHIS